MNIGHFYLPTEILAGEHCVNQQRDKWLLGRHALVVTGKQSAIASGALADVLNVLEANHIRISQFDGICANPDKAQIYQGAAMGKGCDFVIGIGGGSAMDAAKAIAWVLGSGIREEDFWTKPLEDDIVLPIVEIPLTCGTGSEVTQYAIITDTEAQTKANVSSLKFFPRVALLDPNYLNSLPTSILCDTALDALSHAIEGALSPRSTSVALSLAKDAIKVLMPELRYLAEGTTVNREKLQYGSMLAGIVIAQAGTGLVHAMGYPLTYYLGMPHGRANGILLAGYLDFMQRTCGAIVMELLEAGDCHGIDELQALIDQLMTLEGITRPTPTEEELIRFTREPLQLEKVRRYRTMPSPEEVMDIYRTGF